MPTSDLDLLTQWRGGDRQAGQRLFRRHFAAVARFFCNKADSDHEDLVQRTFVGCLEGADRFRAECSFRTYLLRIAYHVLCSHYRTKYRRGEALTPSEVSLRDLSSSPSSVVARNRRHQQLIEALRMMSIDYQVVLELYFWEEMTAAEIAGVLEIPLGTAQTRLRRAREGLAKQIGDLEGAPMDSAEVAHEIEAWARELRTLVSERRAAAP